MLKKLLISVLFFSFFFASCTQYEYTQAPPVKPLEVVKYELKEKRDTFTRFFYKGGYFRDPFVQLSGEGSYSSEEIVSPNINSLTLQGVVNSETDAYALFKSGNSGYYLSNGKLYDTRSRLIIGFSGLTDGDTVHLRAPDGTRKEFKIKDITLS